MKWLISILAATSAIFLAACDSILPTTTTRNDAAPTVASVVEQPAVTDNNSTVAYTGPDWTSLPLVNARTGEAVTFADFAGKTVFVEPMATWCSNCRSQQRTLSSAIAQIGTEDVVYISLSVETNLTAPRLADYATQNNFDWTFIVATPELMSALITQFGRGVNTPPSTPHFTISPDGTVSALSTGMSSADDIAAMIATARQS